jgi:xanthine dehydrogenase accessory factor
MQQCLTRLENDVDIWLFIDITSPSNWVMGFYGKGFQLNGTGLNDEDVKALFRNKAGLVEIKNRLIYSGPISNTGRVFIFGAGHVTQALQPLLASTDFRCVVFDDRAELLNSGLFPDAHSLIHGDFHNIGEKVTINSQDYIIIATYNCDIAVLRQLISKNWAYLGLIGSKNKIAAAKEQLLKEGVCAEKLSAINAPIGLNIRSETPEEIAVSIAGKLILHRAELQESRECLWS